LAVATDQLDDDIDIGGVSQSDRIVEPAAGRHVGATPFRLVASRHGHDLDGPSGAHGQKVALCFK
jgi:hypothetical protein